MASHNDTGKLGESLATDYFKNLGYTILEQNWRTGRLEVDLIAHKNNILHFIEVKSRRNNNFGAPEENVNKKKITKLIDASEQYLFLHSEWKRIQFDVLSITLLANSAPQYFLIEDVFE